MFMEVDGQEPGEYLASTFAKHLPFVDSAGMELNSTDDIEGNSGEKFVKALQNTAYAVSYLPVVLRSMPVPSAHLPNMDICTELFFQLCSLYWTDAPDRQEALVLAQQKAGRMPGRLPFLCLSHLYRKMGKPRLEYEYGHKAFQAFAQCGASYRAYYDGWNSLRLENLREENTESLEPYRTPEQLKELFCPYPFERCFINATPNNTGNVTTIPCQTSLWLSHGTRANAGSDGIDFWNSLPFQEIRRSILDGDYRYCSIVRCPMFVEGRLKKKSEVKDPYHKYVIENSVTVVDRPPARLILSYDHSCNLNCVSCREKKFTALPEASRHFDAIVDKLIIPMLSEEHPSTIRMSPCGEVFASRHFMKLLKEFPYDRFPRHQWEIMTNGELLKEAWSKIGKGNEHIKEIMISFDGISKRTYEAWRRGGDFSRFMEGLNFAHQLLADGKIGWLDASTTVTGLNLPELVAMFRYCAERKVSRFVVNKITNWGTFTQQEFDKLDIWSTEHPMHGQFQNAIRKIQSLKPQYPETEFYLAAYIKL